MKLSQTRNKNYFILQFYTSIIFYSDSADWIGKTTIKFKTVKHCGPSKPHAKESFLKKIKSCTLKSTKEKGSLLTERER
jgi:hypothetical protein